MKKVRIIVDVAMTVLMPMLIAYSLIGEKFHELIGTIIFVLFLYHNWLNRGFWKNLFKGHYTPQRIFRTILNISLIVMMFLQPLSGVVMSKHVFVFLPQLGISATARQIHMVLAYWFYVLMSIHLGTHVEMMAAKLRNMTSRNARIGIWLLIDIIAFYGIFAFTKRQFPAYMFMKMPFAFFDYSEPRVFFFVDYISIMVACADIGFLMIKGLGAISNLKSKRSI